MNPTRSRNTYIPPGEVFPCPVYDRTFAMNLSLALGNLTMESPSMRQGLKAGTKRRHSSSLQFATSKDTAHHWSVLICTVLDKLGFVHCY